MQVSNSPAGFDRQGLLLCFLHLTIKLIKRLSRSSRYHSVGNVIRVSDVSYIPHFTMIANER